MLSVRKWDGTVYAYSLGKVKITMNIIRYRTPELATWPQFNRLSSLRDILGSALQFSNLPEKWAPALDVFEDEDKVSVQVEVPGMKKDDFDISLHDDVLTVTGERKAESEQQKGESFRRERVFGSFRRSVTLPAPVKGDEVKASYQDGILTVTLPKAEESKPRKIQVNLN